MTDNPKEPLNGIYLEVSSDGFGSIQVGGGAEFSDDVGKEYTETMENLLLGIVSSLGGSFSKLVEMGEILQRDPNFKWSDYGIEHDGQEGSDSNILDIKDFFNTRDPKNNRRH